MQTEVAVLLYVILPTKTLCVRFQVLKEENILIAKNNVFRSGLSKKQRLNWLGHVESMAEDNDVKKIEIETHV